MTNTAGAARFTPAAQPHPSCPAPSEAWRGPTERPYMGPSTGTRSPGRWGGARDKGVCTSGSNHSCHRPLFNLLKVPDCTRGPTQLGGSRVLLDLQLGVGWCVWRPLGLAEDSDGKGDPKLS